MPYGLCACADVTHARTKPASAAMRSSRIGIGHLAISCDAPGPDCVVVVIIVIPANREKFGQRRLDVAGFIGRAALNDDRFAVPTPWKPEAGQCPRHHRILQLGDPPTRAVINRDIDAFDLAQPAPGNTANLVKTPRDQSLAA